MRSTRTLLLLAAVPLCALCASAARAFITPIDSLNYNVSNGVPLLNRRLVTVQGTVTCQDSILSPTNTDVMIQDQTGGTNVFASNALATFRFALGDSVQVTGYAIPFHGGVALDSTTALLNVQHLGPPPTLPDPMLPTCA